MAARIVPFGVYFLFLLIEQAVRWMDTAAVLPSLLVEGSHLWLYPVKTLAVMTALVWYWPHYDELRRPHALSLRTMILAIGVGLGVYMAWVRMDWSWTIQGARAAGYDPFSSQSVSAYGLAAFRLFGAAVVVPVMEELFWRSFLMRYLISSRFEAVQLGVLTPFSFGLMVVLFGVEHDLWLAGMMAGAAYGLLLYRTRSLWACVLAHGITNLALGIHVLMTHEWYWW